MGACALGQGPRAPWGCIGIAPRLGGGAEGDTWRGATPSRLHSVGAAEGQGAGGGGRCSGGGSMHVN